MHGRKTCKPPRTFQGRAFHADPEIRRLPLPGEGPRGCSFVPLGGETPSPSFPLKPSPHSAAFEPDTRPDACSCLASSQSHLSPELSLCPSSLRLFFCPPSPFSHQASKVKSRSSQAPHNPRSSGPPAVGTLIFRVSPTERGRRGSKGLRSPRPPGHFRVPRQLVFPLKQPLTVSGTGFAVTPSGGRHPRRAKRVESGLRS